MASNDKKLEDVFNSLIENIQLVIDQIRGKISDKVWHNWFTEFRVSDFEDKQGDQQLNLSCEMWVSDN